MRIFDIGEVVRVRSSEDIVKICWQLSISPPHPNLLEFISGKCVKISDVFKDYLNHVIYYTEEELRVGNQRLLFLYSEFVEEILSNKMTFYPG